MKKPKDWYSFSNECKLYHSSDSNMAPSSQQQYCRRKDRQGKDRPDYDPLKCHWNVCPRLKEKRKKDKKNEESK